MVLNPEVQKNIDIINSACQTKHGPAWNSFIEKPFIIGTFKAHATDSLAIETAGGYLHSSPQMFSPPRNSYAVRHRIECNDDHTNQQSLGDLHQAVNRAHLEALRELAVDPALADQKLYVLHGDHLVLETLGELVKRSDYASTQLTFTPYTDDITGQYYCEDQDNKIQFYLLSPSSKLASALGEHLALYKGVRTQNLIDQQTSGWKL